MQKKKKISFLSVRKNAFIINSSNFRQTKGCTLRLYQWKSQFPINKMHVDYWHNSLLKIKLSVGCTDRKKSFDTFLHRSKEEWLQVFRILSMLIDFSSQAWSERKNIFILNAAWKTMRNFSIRFIIFCCFVWH